MANVPKLYLQTELEFETYLRELGELSEAVKASLRQARSDQLQLKQEKATEEHLRLLEAVLFQVQDGVMITEAEQDAEPPFQILYINEAFSRMTGYRPEEIIGQTPRILQGPETDQQILAQVHQALARHQPVRAEVINYRKDGAPFWMAFEISPLFDQEGNCNHFFAIQHDVTERKQLEQELRRHRDHLDELVRERTAELSGINEQLTQEIAERERVEEALRQSEARSALAQRVADVGIWDRELSSNKLYWSEQTEAIFGFEPGTFSGTLDAFLACVHPEDREILLAANKASIVEGQEYVLEHRIIRLDGAIRWVLERGNAIRDAQGRPIRFMGVVQDITERKRAAQTLRESEQRYRLLAEYSLDGIALIEEGRLVYVSPAYEQIHGYPAEQFVGRDFEAIMELVHPDDRERILRFIDRSKPVQKYSFRFKRQDGHYVWIEDVVRRIFDAQGQLLRTIISSREVSERKALEEQLYQSQKMEALGRLAGGVAHHFNNTLTAIIGFIELAMTNLPAYYPAVKDLEQAHASAMKAASMTHQLVAFTRRQVVQSRPFNLNDLVTQGQVLFARLIPVSVTLVTDLAPDAGQIKIDRSQFEQLLINLVVNGCEAMADGGRLTIETASIILAEAEEALGPQLPARPYARLAVRDTGVGMSEAVQARIFEPFFTTKTVGQGTGLGLSTCYGIVKQHGGDIRVESRVGQGTSVYVYLPQVGTSE